MNYLEEIEMGEPEDNFNDFINYPRDEKYYNETSDKIWDTLLVMNGIYTEKNNNETDDAFRLRKIEIIQKLFKKMPITKEILELPDDLIKRDILSDFSLYYYQNFEKLSPEERQDLFQFFPHFKVDLQSIIDYKISNNLEYAKLGLRGTKTKNDFEKLYHLSRDSKIIDENVIKHFMGLEKPNDTSDNLQLYDDAGYIIQDENGFKRGAIRRGIDTIYHTLVNTRIKPDQPFYRNKKPSDNVSTDHTLYHPILRQSESNITVQSDRISESTGREHYNRARDFNKLLSGNERREDGRLR